MVLGNHPLVKAPGNIYQWMTHQPNSLNFIKGKRCASVKRKTEKRFVAVHLSWFLLSVCIGWQGCVPHPILCHSSIELSCSHCSKTSFALVYVGCLALRSRVPS